MSKHKSDIEVRHENAAPAPSEGWAPLTSIREEIDRLFDDFGTGLWRRPSARQMHSLFPALSALAVTPAMEVVDCNGDYRVTAELPGMAADDIEVKLTDGSLTIRGEKTEIKKEEKDDYLLNERRYGSFHRSIPLPSGVNAEAVSADFSNGVLTVTLPKTDEAKQKERKVEVKSG